MVRGARVPHQGGTSGPGPLGTVMAACSDATERGTLPADWTEWFTDLVATPTTGGDTALVGVLPDHTSLHAVLTRVRDLELVSLSTAPPTALSAPLATDLAADPPGPGQGGQRWLLVAGVTGLWAVGVYVGATVLGGVVHLALAAVSSLVTLACAVLYGLAFRTDERWRSLSRPTFGCAALILLSAPAAALSVGTNHMGLFERVTIGTFMVWIVHLGVVALRTYRSPAAPRPSI